MWNSRDYRISQYSTDGEVVQTMFLAAKVAETHEILESFKYKNKILFNPHWDLDALIETNIPEKTRN